VAWLFVEALIFRPVSPKTHSLRWIGRPKQRANRRVHYQAELYRLKGAIFAETGEHAEAASWFQQAIDTARSQQAKSLELRAATRLARLWAEQRGAEGLRPPRAGVRLLQGFDITGLKHAKALLDALS
jgi:predicted ATPase